RNRLNLAEPARPSDSRTRSSLGTPGGRFLVSVKSLYTTQSRPHGRHGGCSSAGRASGCGPEGRGFKSRHSPKVAPESLRFRGFLLESCGFPETVKPP